jgi:hypothetical protein
MKLTRNDINKQRSSDYFLVRRLLNWKLRDQERGVLSANWSRGETLYSS